MVKIYGLYDPRTNELRYVGKTIEEIKRRLTNHIAESKSRHTHKDNWIKSLTAMGLRPIIKLIDEVENSEWQFWEVTYIAHFKNLGHNLTNHTIGGETGATSDIPFNVVEYHKNWQKQNKNSVRKYTKKYNEKKKEMLDFPDYFFI